MRRGNGELSIPVSARRGEPEIDLVRMLLPSSSAHIPKGKAAMWERHFQQESSHKQRTPAKTPTRPQISHRPNVVHSANHSPRYSLTGPAIASPPQRCHSAGPCSTPRRIKLCDIQQQLVSTVADPRLEPEAPDGSQIDEKSAKAGLNRPLLNMEAREHLEMKACMLAHMHRIDVDSLHQLREVMNQELDSIKTKQLVARGGIMDDGSLVETTKRKTMFLLRHFFSLGEPSSSTASTHQENVIYDIVDEWSCRDNANADEIGTLWRSIISHIEHSYVLRRHLVPKAEPNPLSITIAMDCLRKLPNKLPDYRRLLDVVISLIETGLYLPTDNPRDERIACNSVEAGTGSLPSFVSTKSYFFEEYRAVRDNLDRELEEKRARLAAEALHDASRAQTPRQQLESLLMELRLVSPSPNGAHSEKEALFSTFFHSDTTRLTPVALREVLKVCFNADHPSGDYKQLFFDLWMPLLQVDDAEEVLVQLVNRHIGAFQTFFLEDFEAMDKLLMEPLPPPSNAPTTNCSRRSSNAVLSGSTRRNGRMNHRTLSSSDSPATTLFQQLIERHPTQFASVLWSSPYLTAHVFQDSQHLIARILEQNIVSISHVLHQRPDIFTTLLNHTLKDSTIAIEEYLNNHPKAFSDLLLNKGAAVSTAIKNYPVILVDILQASRPTLAKVLSSMPELLCHLFKSTPEILAQTIREDLTLLPLAFSVVPQCLSDALERHPEYFVDVAHRKPALVAKVFAKYPDLLLDPLEANPSVFSNFLIYHRKILPDFSSPSFDPSFFQFQRKQYADSAQQTEKRLCKHDGKLRMREKIKIQEDAQVYEVRQTLATIAAAMSGNGRTTPGGGNGRATPSLVSDRPSTKEAKTANGSVVPLSPGQVVNEIARIYLKKVSDDALMDTSGKKHCVLVDFVLDLYIQELGFKRKAQQKLTHLLTGAQQSEQESLRIKWFLRFMNAGAISSSPITSEPADVLWTYHPLASEFYLTALQFLVSLPLNQLSRLLEEELSRPCLVGYTRVKQFIEDPLMTRMLPSKDQRQQLLTKICEKEQLIHGTASESIMTPKANSSFSVTTLHLEDVLELFMLEWIRYQDRVKGEWTMQFQLINPDGSGVVRYNNFVNLIRAKVPSMVDRAILKVFHQCGEENELGEYFIAVDDFSLAMSIIQERDSIREYAARVASTSSFS